MDRKRKSHFRLRVPAHVIPDAVIIKQPFDAPHRADRHILIPQLFPRKRHDVLFGNLPDDPLDFFGVHPAAGGHDLPADVFGDGGGAVEGQEDGGLQLGFGAFGFGFGHVVGKSGPFAKGEVHEVVDLFLVFCDEVDSP